MAISPKQLKTFASASDAQKKFKPRPPGEAHAPVAKMNLKGGKGGGAGPDDDQDDDRDEDEGSDEADKGGEPDFKDEMEKNFLHDLQEEFPQLSSILDDLEDAHKSGDKAALDDSVNELCDFLAGHGGASSSDKGDDEDDGDKKPSDDDDDEDEDEDDQGGE